MYERYALVSKHNVMIGWPWKLSGKEVRVRVGCITLNGFGEKLGGGNTLFNKVKLVLIS